MNIFAKVASALLLTVLVVAIVSCGRDAIGTTSVSATTAPSAPATTALVETSATTSPTTSTSETVTTTGPPKSRSQVVPLGSEAQVGGWMVAVVSAVLGADEVVANHSEFNDRPLDGRHYVLVMVRATRSAEGSGEFSGEVYSIFQGSGGDVFEMSPEDIPEPLRQAEAMENGATVTGNLVFEVAEEQIMGGQLVMEATAAGGSPVLFEVE